MTCRAVLIDRRNARSDSSIISTNRSLVKNSLLNSTSLPSLSSPSPSLTPHPGEGADLGEATPEAPSPPVLVRGLSMDIRAGGSTLIMGPSVRRGCCFSPCFLVLLLLLRVGRTRHFHFFPTLDASTSFFTPFPPVHPLSRSLPAAPPHISTHPHLTPTPLPQGCGKSSLLRSLAGLWTEGAGRVVRHGTVVSERNPGGDIMFVPQASRGHSFWMPIIAFESSEPLV